MSAPRLLAALLLLPCVLPLPADVLKWSEIASLPNKLGVAGPFVGVHNGALIVAGGANFRRPIWETDKVWYDEIYVLEKEGDEFKWHSAGKLPRKTGYGAAVSTSEGIVCLGGNDGVNTFKDAYILSWDRRSEKISREPLPSLPEPCAYGQATAIGKTVYLAGGQSGNPLDTAMKNFWAIDLGKANPKWRKMKAWPGATRAFNLTVAQHNGRMDCVYVMSGRRQNGDQVEFLKDVWEFNPGSGKWRKRKDMPACRMAGTAIASGRNQVFVLGGADGSLWAKAPELADKHPGFPKEALKYHSVTDTWTSAGPMPANHVTTVPVKWGRELIVATGEIRPRVRSPKIWSIKVIGGKRSRR